MEVDTSKNLAELTGVRWPPLPLDARELVRERYTFYHKSIRDLANHEIAKLITINIAVEVLIPIALVRLRETPDDTRLLCAVLLADTFAWRQHPELVAKIRRIIYDADVEIGSITDEREKLAQFTVLWRAYAGFERRISAIL